jgi:hypothetical protein
MRVLMAGRPTYASRVPRVTDLESAELGASMLGMPLKPQGQRIARLLEARRGPAALYGEVVLQVPRRATKTTAVLATLIGRCATREGHLVVFTAQSGTVASRIISQLADTLVRRGHAVGAREARSSPGHIVYSASQGRESLVWPNGSRLWCVPPDPGAVRSQAADDVVMDEAGEYDVVKGRAFYNAVAPLMDTRGPLAQLIVMGTPGEARAGLLWDLLVLGRERTRGIGILDWCVLDGEDIEDRRIWRRVHPGPSSGLTPMTVLERRRKQLGPEAFAREYLGKWPEDSSVAAINPDAWRSCASTLPERPPWFSVAFDCSPDASSATIVAAWRDDDGLARVEVVEARPGTAWVAREAYRIGRKHRVVVAFDPVGQNLDVGELLARQRPLVKTHALTFRDMQGAAARFVADINGGKLRHAQQPDLDRAVEGASWRQVGDAGRLFGRRASTADVTPLVAATAALWTFDTHPRVTPLKVVTRAH